MARPVERTASETSSSGILGTREEAMYRLKVGVGGLLAVLLIVAIASSIMQSARLTEDPQTTAAREEASNEPANDPLVDIGVVPEMPGDKKVVVPDLPAAQMPPEMQSEDAAAEGGQPAGD